MHADVLPAQIMLYARELKMPGLSGAFEEITRDAAKAGRGHLESLAACLAAEIESRTEHRLASRIKSARFPALKTFDTFRFSPVPPTPRGRGLGVAGGAALSLAGWWLGLAMLRGLAGLAVELIGRDR